MSAGSGPLPPPLPCPPKAGRQALLLALVGLALALAITLAALVYFLRPAPRVGYSTPAPFIPNPDAPILATDVYTGADDFVVDVFHNGRRVPDEARLMYAEVYGATGERVRVTVRAGDWLVFNVANNRLRWDGAHYFGAAGVRPDGSVAFVSEESLQWSVCEDPGYVPRFIAEPQFLATHAARRIEKPWAGGDRMIKSKVSDWSGHAIWGAPTNRNIWIKFRASEEH